MDTWIFQGNPEKFNLDAYLEQNKHIRWSIRQEHFLNIVIEGHVVYIWRSEANKRVEEEL